MRGWIGPIIFAIVTGIAAHWATLSYAPGVIMERTLETLENRNVALHAFTNPQRITPETQAVVRTSPDLFYALCRYDLSSVGSVLSVTMGEWPGYQSLSFFDAETNNFATIRGEGRSVTANLVSPVIGTGSASFFAPGPDDVISPTDRGVVLIRRLAQTQELFDQALEAAKNDRCEIGYS